MKRSIMIIALVLASAALAGCTVVSGDPTATLVPEATEFPASKATLSPMDPAGLVKETMAPAALTASALFWDSFRIGGSTEAPVAASVFTSLSELTEELEIAEPEIAARYEERRFETMFVVAVYVTANTGGWTYELTEASVTDGRVSIDIKGAGPDGPATQAFERHVVLVAFDSSLYSEELKIEVLINGAPVEMGKEM